MPRRLGLRLSRLALALWARLWGRFQEIEQQGIALSILGVWQGFRLGHLAHLTHIAYRRPEHSRRSMWTSLSPGIGVCSLRAETLAVVGVSYLGNAALHRL